MHGIQAKLSGQKRKSGDVPIPSFSCVSPAAEKSEMPCWNQWSLTQAEAALAVSRIRRGPSKWSSEGLLQFDDFYSLVRQLSLVEPPKTEDPDGLSSPERLLYDLVSLGSPLLYQICQNEKNQWCLKLVDYQGNRVAALRQLMLDTPKLNAVAANKRNVILDAIFESMEKILETMSKICQKRRFWSPLFSRECRWKIASKLVQVLDKNGKQRQLSRRNLASQIILVFFDWQMPCGLTRDIFRNDNFSKTQKSLPTCDRLA